MPLRGMGDWSIALSYLTSALMEVSGYLHAPAGLLRGRVPPMSPRARLDAVEKRKKFLALPGV
jgi:hypothetical protein